MDIFELKDQEIEDFVESYQKAHELIVSIKHRTFNHVDEIKDMVNIRLELAAHKSSISSKVGKFKINSAMFEATRKKTFAVNNKKYIFSDKLPIGKAKAKADVDSNEFLEKEKLYDSLYHTGRVHLDNITTILQILRDKESNLKFEWDLSKNKH